MPLSVHPLWAFLFCPKHYVCNLLFKVFGCCLLLMTLSSWGFLRVHWVFVWCGDSPFPSTLLLTLKDICVVHVYQMRATSTNTTAVVRQSWQNLFWNCLGCTGTLMYTHMMSQLEEETVGCKLLHTWQYLWDMNIHYNYVHPTYNATSIEVCHSKQRNFNHKVQLHVEAWEISELKRWITDQLRVE